MKTIAITYTKLQSLTPAAPTVAALAVACAWIATMAHFVRVWH